MKLAKDFIYNFLNLLLLVITPILTIPYTSRIFNPEIMGSLAYTSSMTRWFSIFASFSLLIYASKKISATPDDQKNIVFSEIFWLNALSTTILIIFFGVYVIFDGKYLSLFAIQSLVLIGNFFEVSWYFVGIQNFRIGLIRNILTKLTSIILILTLIKTPSDLWLYLLIQVGTNFVSGIFYFTKSPSIFSFQKSFIIKSFSTHFKESIAFFIPFLISQIYTVFDKILILNLGNAWQLGIYDAAGKVIIMLMLFSTSITGVLLPKLSQLVSIKDNGNINRHLKLSLLLCNTSGFALAIFLFAFSKPFVILFFGSNFQEAAEILRILSPMMLLLAWNSITSLQVLYPHNAQNSITISVSIGVTLSLLINILFIPKFGAIASAWAWVISEFVIVTLQLIFSLKFVPLLKLSKQSIPFFATTTIYLTMTFSTNKPQPIILPILSILTIILIGTFVFFKNKSEFGKALKS